MIVAPLVAVLSVVFLLLPAPGPSPVRRLPPVSGRVLTHLVRHMNGFMALYEIDGSFEHTDLKAGRPPRSRSSRICNNRKHRTKTVGQLPISLADGMMKGSHGQPARTHAHRSAERSSARRRREGVKTPICISPHAAEQLIEAGVDDFKHMSGHALLLKPPVSAGGVVTPTRSFLRARNATPKAIANH